MAHEPFLHSDAHHRRINSAAREQFIVQCWGSFPGRIEAANHNMEHYRMGIEPNAREHGASRRIMTLVFRWVGRTVLGLPRPRHVVLNTQPGSSHASWLISLKFPTVTTTAVLAPRNHYDSVVVLR